MQLTMCQRKSYSLYFHDGKGLGVLFFDQFIKGTSTSLLQWIKGGELYPSQSNWSISAVLDRKAPNSWFIAEPHRKPFYLSEPEYLRGVPPETFWHHPYNFSMLVYKQCPVSIPWGCCLRCVPSFTQHSPTQVQPPSTSCLSVDGPFTELC